MELSILKSSHPKGRMKLMNLFFLVIIMGFDVVRNNGGSVVASTLERNSESLVNLLEPPNQKQLHPGNNRRHCILFEGKTTAEETDEMEHPSSHPHNNSTSSSEITEMICAKESEYCFALWIHNESTGTSFIKRGCWQPSTEKECKNNSQCIAEVPNPNHNQTEAAMFPDELNNLEKEKPTSNKKDQHYFCCCKEDGCNMDVKILYVEPAPVSVKDFKTTEKRDILPIILTCTGSIMFGLIIIFTGYRYWRRISFQYNKNGGCNGEAGEGNGGGDGLNPNDLPEGKALLLHTENSIDDSIFGGIQLELLLARGKFASVYEGKIPSMSDRSYALKCFTKDQNEFFENERFVFNYLGKHCNHDNIIKYHGWQYFTVGPTTHLILVLDKISPGNLREYLQSVTDTKGSQEGLNDKQNPNFDIMDVLKIASGIASGLSYLHGENRDEIVIAHRDLTSKNILLDGETLIPKITDFGLSLVTEGTKYYWAGRERKAEFCSLAEAGTLRYMSPELLEGAVNLKDCENALKQADVYAMALIIWEVANCSYDVRLTQIPKQQQQQQQQQDLQISEVAEFSAEDETEDKISSFGILPVKHSLPYEDEIGKESFSMDVLTRHVVQYRNRPRFSRWRETPQTRLLRDTLVESWDAEPDARLTALCIVERLADICNIRLKNIDLSGNSRVSNQQQEQMPLENPGQNNLYSPASISIDSPWTGRNPCLQRNLLTVTASVANPSGESIISGGGGMSTSDSEILGSNNLVMEGQDHHPLVLQHSDFAKDHTNLYFYNNYVTGSTSGGASYSSGSVGASSTTPIIIGGRNNTEMGYINTNTRDDRIYRPSSYIETRFQNSSAETSVETAQTSVGSPQSVHNPIMGGGVPVPPPIPFVQNLHT